MAFQGKNQCFARCKIHDKCYKDADCEKLMEYANTLTVMNHAYVIEHVRAQNKGSNVRKKKLRSRLIHTFEARG